MGVEVFTTPDPGRAATTGRPEDLNMFEVPTLRGIKHTAPYFHDHSIGSLEAVIEHYNRTFGFGIIGRRQQDLLAFLENL
jgi:cytochrome c peroxidase